MTYVSKRPQFTPADPAKLQGVARRVIELRLEGCGNSAIALRLSIDRRAVSNYVTQARIVCGYSKSPADRLESMRARRFAAGKCGDCGVRPFAPGRKLCANCNEKKRDYAAARDRGVTVDEPDDNSGARCRCGLRLPCLDCVTLDRFMRTGASNLGEAERWR